MLEPSRVNEQQQKKKIRTEADLWGRRSIAKWCSNKKIFGSRITASNRALSISLPVISAAWTILWWEWPPSLARCKLPSSPWSKDAPIAISSKTLSGPSVHTTWENQTSSAEAQQRQKCQSFDCNDMNYMNQNKPTWEIVFNNDQTLSRSI